MHVSLVRTGKTAADMQDDMAGAGGHTGRVQKRTEGGLVGVPDYGQLRNYEYRQKKRSRSNGESVSAMILNDTCLIHTDTC